MQLQPGFGGGTKGAEELNEVVTAGPKNCTTDRAGRATRTACSSRVSAPPSDGARSVTAAAPHFVGSSVAWPPTCCQRPFRFIVARYHPGLIPLWHPFRECCHALLVT